MTDTARHTVVLLHALGSSRRSWAPVVSALEEHFDVVALDLPGFGEAAPLPHEVVPTPRALAAAVAATLDEGGIRNPHVVGNSIGGWVALEVAALRPVASLTLLSPAGMWAGRTPAYCRISLRTTRRLARRWPGLLSRIVRTRVGRFLVLAQSHGRPGLVSAEQAVDAVRTLGECPGFDSTLAATLDIRYEPSVDLELPATVAYGSRDRILLRRRWRGTDRLPRGTVVAKLPGCGHLPMFDDPVAVAGLILGSVERAEGAERAAIGRDGEGHAA